LSDLRGRTPVRAPRWSGVDDPRRARRAGSPRRAARARARTGRRRGAAGGRHRPARLLVRAPGGNFLWDCLGFIDDKSVAAIRAMGGVAGIAMSHPHFYGVMVEWSQAFG